MTKDEFHQIVHSIPSEWGKLCAKSLISQLCSKEHSTILGLEPYIAKNVIDRVKKGIESIKETECEAEMKVKEALKEKMDKKKSSIDTLMQRLNHPYLSEENKNKLNNILASEDRKHCNYEAVLDDPSDKRFLSRVLRMQTKLVGEKRSLKL